MAQNPSTGALEAGYSKCMLHRWYQFVICGLIEPEVTEFESHTSLIHVTSRRYMVKSSTIEASVPVSLRCSVVFTSIYKPTAR